MRARPTRARVLLELAVALAMLGCEPPPSTHSAGGSAPATSASTGEASRPAREAPAPKRSGALCKKLESDRTFDAAHATTGDVLVLKYSSQFDDHADVATTAKDLGASSAEPMVVEKGAVYGKRGMMERVASGLTDAALKRLEKFLVKGRLPAGMANEVALSTRDAHDLGVSVGDDVSVYFRQYRFPLGGDGHPTADKPKAKVVGLFDVGDTLGGNRSSMWMTLKAVQILHPDLYGSLVTAVAVHLKAGADAKPWAGKLGTKLGSTFHAMTHEQLQEGALKSRDDLLSLCRRSTPPPHPPKPFTLNLPDCKGDLGALAPIKALTFATHGHAMLAGKARWAYELEELKWVTSAFERREAIVSFQAILFNDAEAVPTDLLGTMSLSALCRYVVKGDIAHLSAKGGVGIHDIAADALGVTVGDTIHLAVRPPALTPDDSPGSWTANIVKIGALLRFPHGVLSAHLTDVFVHRDFATTLHRAVPAGHANALLVWKKTSDESLLPTDFSNATSHNLVASQSANLAITATEQSLFALEELCRGP